MRPDLTRRKAIWLGFLISDSGYEPSDQFWNMDDWGKIL